MVSDAFAVTVTSEDGVWVAVVHGVRDAIVKTRRLSALDPQVRELLADALDRPSGSFALEYRLREDSNQAASR
jgi:hypothetical protein